MKASLRLLAGLSCFSGFLFPLIAQREPDVLVVSETFGRPTEETRPTAEHPIYYHLLGGAQLDIGGQITGEKMPAPAALESLVHQTLSSQGFRRTEPDGPAPNIIVTYAFGSVAVDQNEWAAESKDSADENTVDPSPDLNSSEYANGGQILHLIGANRMQNRRMDSKTAELFDRALHQDRLYITVSAMSAPALLRQQRKITWRTKISIELDRNSLPDAMHVMMASAAPYIGMATDMPVFMGPRDRRETAIHIGELEVIDSDPR